MNEKSMQVFSYKWRKKKPFYIDDEDEITMMTSTIRLVDHTIKRKI